MLGLRASVALFAGFVPLSRICMAPPKKFSCPLGLNPDSATGPYVVQNHVKLEDFRFKIEVYHMKKSLASLSYNTSKQRHMLLGIVSVSGFVGRRFKARLRHFIDA